MSTNIRNKTVVITGGAQGIGFHIGTHFLKNGAKTFIILDINEESGSKAVQKLAAEYGSDAVQFIKCDITTDLERIYEQIIDTYKTIDVLVNNAGVGSIEGWKKLIEVNLVAVMEWTMKFQDHMRIDNGGKGGTIINIASVYGFRSDSVITPEYTASKHGVIGFTRSLGDHNNFRSRGVRVLAICPGFTRTDIVRQLTERRPEYVDSVVWQQPEDVGRAALEVFNSADSGTVWIVEGGNPVQQLRASDQ